MTKSQGRQSQKHKGQYEKHYEITAARKARRKVMEAKKIREDNVEHNTYAQNRLVRQVQNRRFKMASYHRGERILGVKTIACLARLARRKRSRIKVAASPSSAN